jgi:GINS complex subunit 4
MDISDILQDLNSRSLAHDPFADSNGDVYGSGRAQASGQADLQALTRAWINERGATELLPQVYTFQQPRAPSANIYPVADGPKTA